MLEFRAPSLCKHGDEIQTEPGAAPFTTETTLNSRLELSGTNIQRADRRKAERRVQYPFTKFFALALCQQLKDTAGVVEPESVTPWRNPRTLLVIMRSSGSDASLPDGNLA